MRAEQYIKCYTELRLAQHTENEVNAVFEKLEREGKLLDWQYRQFVDAVEYLFHNIPDIRVS